MVTAIIIITCRDTIIIYLVLIQLSIKHISVHTHKLMK